jgi:hypothetical protein
MSDAITVQRVHIELSRVQTWLFAVPRLRAMVGANAPLGETLRVALPKLARENGRGWALAPSSETYPGADANGRLAVLEKIETLQPEQRKLNARLFVRWLRAEMRKGAP